MAVNDLCITKTQCDVQIVCSSWLGFNVYLICLLIHWEDLRRGFSCDVIIFTNSSLAVLFKLFFHEE